MLGPSLAPTERVPARIVSRGCCRRAYLRGAFIGCGSLSRPRSAAHLEWRVSSDTAALQLQELAEVEGFTLGVHETPRYWLAYAKSRETIRGLLAALGAHGAELRLEEEGVFAWAREEANRLANADAGNLRRQAAAAARHTRRDRAGGRARRAAARAARRRRAAPAPARRHARRAGRGGHAAPDQVGRRLAPAAHRRSGRTCNGASVESSRGRGASTARRHGQTRGQHARSRRDQRLRPHRPQLLPRREGVRRRHRLRGGQRPHGRRHARAPAQVRLRARPLQGRRRGLRATA